MFKRGLITLTLIICYSMAFSDAMSPIGKWRTIDDETGEAKSIISINLESGKLQGHIETLLNPSKPNPVCEECKGDKHNQAIEGLTFLWGLSESKQEWKGGKILDPETGKEYKAKLKVIDDGTKIEVRGFIGFALIGRTQIWERVE